MYGLTFKWKTADNINLMNETTNHKLKRKEGTATHSSILAWTEEPGGLQPIGLQESDRTEAT